MATLSAAQVYGYARAGGFSTAEAIVATAIAMAESGGRTDAVGDVGLQTGTWGPSVGLWQVRSLKAQSGTGGVRDATKLADPTFNARSAYRIYRDAGAKWTPWSVYTSGAYRKNLTAAQGAAASGGAGVTLPGTGGSASSPGLTPGVSLGSGAGLLDGLLDGAAGAAGDALGSAAAGAAESVWAKVQPFLVTAGAAALGLALLGAGVLVTAWPTTRTTGGTA